MKKILIPFSLFALAALGFAVGTFVPPMAAHADPTHAPDPVATVTSGYDAGLAVWTQDGPIWAGLVVLMLVLRTFLDRQHWLQQGRVLAGLTGLGAVLAAMLQWHFSGAPAAGIITAVVAALALIQHPTVAPAPAPAREPQAGMARLTVLAVLALCAVAMTAIVSSGCATARTRAEAGVHAFLDCTTPDISKAVADALTVGKRAVMATISGDGHADRATLKADMRDAKTDFTRCLITAAVAAVITPAPQKPGAPAAAELQVDAAGLLEAFGSARRELGWAPVVLPGGKVL